MDEVEDLLERPRLYYNIDGVGELGGSVFCLGYALLLWLVIHAPADSIWHRISIFVFAGLMLLIHYGTKAIKAHITYPRTGYVEYRKRWSTTIVAGAFGAVIPVGLVVAFRGHWDIATVASLVGLAFGPAYAYRFARAVRWKWAVAGVIAAGSMAIALLPGDVLTALADVSTADRPDLAKLAGTVLVSLMVYGSVLLISGGVSFWLYLRHTQAPREGQ